MKKNNPPLNDVANREQIMETREKEEKKERGRRGRGPVLLLLLLLFMPSFTLSRRSRTSLFHFLERTD